MHSAHITPQENITIKLFHNWKEWNLKSILIGVLHYGFWTRKINIMLVSHSNMDLASHLCIRSYVRQKALDSPINFINWSIILIGPSALLFIISHLLQFQFHFYGLGMGNSKPTTLDVRISPWDPNGWGCFNWDMFLPPPTCEHVQYDYVVKPL